jgi:hypothetical protein
VDTTAMPADCYVDGVHFAEAGISEIARRFAEKITRR